MMYAKYQTAITIPFGPVLDSAGAEYTGAVVGDVKISKNNGTPAALNASATLTHKEVGIYELVLTTSDISAVGQATVTLSKTTYVAPPVTLVVLPALVYDSLIGGTDDLQVDTVQITGTPQTARDLGASVLLSSGTGTGQLSLSSGTVTVGTNSDKTGYSLTATTGLGNQTANITGNLSGSVGSVTTVSDKTGYSLANGSLVTATLGTFVLAKTTNITGFNDIAATAIVSGGAITTSGGAVSTVTTTTNATNLTNQYAPKTIFVSKAGNDSNVGSYASPKLTIAGAVSAAASGDTIQIGVGTWSEKVDAATATKSLHFVGANSTESIVTNAGTSNDTGGAADHCFVAYHGCSFRNLRITQTATGDAAGQGIRADGMRGVIIEDCYILSNYDCVYIAAGENCVVHRNVMVGHYDCVNAEDATAPIIRDNYITTDCAATFSDNMRCIILAGSVGAVIENNYLGTTRTSSVAITNATYGIQGGQNATIANCWINVVNTDAANTANLGCIHGNNSSSEIILRGVTFTTSNAGSGTTRHLRNGKFIDLGSNVDTTLIHATSTTWVPTKSDYRMLLGTTIPTPNTAGYPLVDVSKVAGTAQTGGDIAAKTNQLTFTTPNVVDANATVASGGDATAANQALILAQVNKITTQRIEVISHIANNDVVINQGETYSSALNPLTFTYTSGDSWPTDLTSYTITLVGNQVADVQGNQVGSSPASISQAGSVVVATGDARAVRIDFTAAQSAALTPGLYEYYLKASTGSGGSTVDWLRQGQLRVVDATP